MSEDQKMTIRLDDRVHSYKSFLDYSWAKKIEEQVRGTDLDSHFLSLVFALKSTANAFQMPYSMIHIIRAFEDGFLRERESTPEVHLRLLADALPKRMAVQHGLSHKKKKQLQQMITEILQEARHATQTLEGQDPNEMFSSFLHAPSGPELQLAVSGLCQMCFGATFHAYEHFVTECIRWAKRDKTFKAFNFTQLAKELAEAFGEEIADFCVNHDRIQVARAVRNALAHNGGLFVPDMFGKLPPERAAELAEILRTEFYVENDRIQIVAINNINLFEMVKVRVSKLIEKALTLPESSRQ